MSKCEHHRLGQKHSTGLFIYGCGDDVRIHRQSPSARPRLHLHLHGGVFGGEKGTQILIEHKDHFHLTCSEKKSELLSGRRL